MKKLATVILAALVTSSALAGLDPDTDSMGVYFDTAGNTNCTTAAPFMPVTAYLLLMNAADATNGFECSVSMTGVPHVVVSTFFCNSMICDGLYCGPYNFTVGCPSNFPRAGDAMLLVTWNLMLLAPGELLFRVGPSPIPSLPGGLPVVTGNGVLRQCRVSSGDVNAPVAGINATVCPVGDEVDAFGAVKGLFR